MLGPTGRNFAAGMSGGVAFVWDPDKKFIALCNKESVEIEEVLGEDCRLLKSLVEEHKELTRSAVAEHLLENWETSLMSFAKVCKLLTVKAQCLWDVAENTNLKLYKVYAYY